MRQLQEKGEEMYRVNWKDGVPYIEIGHIIDVGRKRKTQKIQWPSEPAKLPLSTGSSTIKKALEKDILDTALLFGDPLLPIEEFMPEPWILARCIWEIMRLRHKLKKHNLI